MSNAVQTDTLLFALKEDIQAALTAPQAAPFQVFFERPRTPVNEDGMGGYTPPYAIVLPKPVKISFAGLLGSVINPDQENEFYLYFVFPWPPDDVPIPLFKIGVASQVIAQIQTGANYHGFGVNPLVTDVDYSEDGDPNERVTEMMLVFNVHTQASHTNSGLG